MKLSAPACPGRLFLKCWSTDLFKLDGSQRVKEEAAGLCSKQERHNLNEDITQQWLSDIKEQVLTGNFQVKRSVFDQVMLLRRLEEEQSLLVTETSQHIMYPLREMQEVERVKGQTMESIKTCNFIDLSEDALHGLINVLDQRLHSLRLLLLWIVVYFPHRRTLRSVITMASQALIQRRTMCKAGNTHCYLLNPELKKHNTQSIKDNRTHHICSYSDVQMYGH